MIIWLACPHWVPEVGRFQNMAKQLTAAGPQFRQLVITNFSQNRLLCGKAAQIRGEDSLSLRTKSFVGQTINIIALLISTMELVLYRDLPLFSKGKHQILLKSIFRRPDLQIYHIFAITIVAVTSCSVDQWEGSILGR